MSATALYVGVNGVAQKVFDSSDFGNLFDSAIDENNSLYDGQPISNFRQVTSYTATEDCYAFVVYEGSGGTNQYPLINGTELIGFRALSGNRISTIIPLKKGDVISSRYYDANESCYFKIAVYGRKPAAVSHDYSTTEQKVGTWIDGKTLYEKTFIITNIPDGNLVYFAHGITNIDGIYSITGVCHAKLSIDPSNAYTPLPRIQDNSTIANLGVDVNSTNIVLKGRGSNFKEVYETVYVTLRYTKSS